LPRLTEQEALEVTKIYSVTGNLPVGHTIMLHRPFRTPHHTTSRIGLIGGGTRPVPGEISLAHKGILFLDEFPEFPRHVLESLRQPVEDGVVTISRASGTVSYPSQFMLIAAANPCPCGNFKSETRPCTCMPGAVQKYQRRLSGPLLERIDIHVFVPSVSVEKFTNANISESSSDIKKRVQDSRDIQLNRFTGLKFQSNSEMSNKYIKLLCPLETEVEKFLRKAVSTLHLSARNYYRIIKVSRTIADLEASQHISINHLAEALRYRPLLEI
jgi:magnesium chelatase family protein